MMLIIPIIYIILYIYIIYFDRLRARVQDAIDHQWETLNLERQIDVVYTPLPSKFVNMNGLGLFILQILYMHMFMHAYVYTY